MYFNICVVFVIGALLSFFSAKTKNERVKDLLKYTTTVCGAFVGLLTAFTLNTNRTNAEKKSHLIDVMQNYAIKVDIFRGRLGMLDSLAAKGWKDSAAFRVFLINKDASFSYPYFTDIRDPAIYSLSGGSTVELQNMDDDVRGVMSEAEKGGYAITISSLKLFSQIAHMQLETEYRYQTGQIDAAELRISSDSIDDVFANAYHMKLHH